MEAIRRVDSKPLLPIHKDEEEKAKPKRVPQEKKPMTRRGMLAALAYMTCAVLLIMFNKSALSVYKFPGANVMTLLQMAVSNVLLFLLRSLRLITFFSLPPAKEEEQQQQEKKKEKQHRLVPLSTLWAASPISIAYLFYMLAGMASIRGVSVPMYTSLRRTTVVFTMGLERLIAGQTHSSLTATSVAIIVFGALVAGLRDFSFSLFGYSLVFISNLTTAIYVTSIAQLGKRLGLTSFGLMWCNGIICMPLILLWCAVSGELSTALAFPSLTDLRFQLLLSSSCLLAFALNFTIFLNTSLNSALTQSMCGNLKDLGTASLGWALFGELPFDLLNIVGQILGFVGSGIFAYSKLTGK